MWLLYFPFTEDELRHSMAKSLPCVRAENVIKASEPKYRLNRTTRLIVRQFFSNAFMLHSQYQELHDTMLVNRSEQSLLKIIKLSINAFKAIIFSIIERLMSA